MPQYFLARHVFVCLQGEHVVFLDIRKDRYFALEAARTAGLDEFVAGWPVPSHTDAAYALHTADGGVVQISRSVDRSAPSAVISLLLEKEILVEAPAQGKSAVPVKAEPSRADLAAEALEEDVTVGARTVLRFASSAMRASLILKYRTFEIAVERVRARVEAACGRAEIVDKDRLHHLIGVFSRLRPYFFTSKDACLFDALALSEFLAHYRIYPHWVFGVQARPFAAHCWLQLGDLVLNDTVEHVKRYTAIMVV